MTMLKQFVKFFFGDKQDRDMKRMKPIIKEINEIYGELEKLSDQELQNKTSEFRRLLGVSPRVCRVGSQIVLLERAEELLARHPDVARTAFVSTRRDIHPGEMVAFVQVRDGVRPSADLANQFRTGMARISNIPDFMPKHVVFLDKMPKEEDERGRGVIPFHRLQLAAEQIELKDWQEERWLDIENKLKEETEKYSLDDVLPEAFAVMKEVCRRHVGKEWSAAGVPIKWVAIPFDVQLAGGIALAQGNISEMGTGEGKTLTAILPLYLNALMCRGSHLVTVNDYLARRDSEWNQPLFEFLGLSVGCLDKTEPHTPQRRAMYSADVTYGTVNEFGFDYLRDNMARNKQQLVQRDYFFAIIDEVDSVLIDEARTPLIISGPVDRSTAQYDRILPGIRELVNRQNMLVGRLAKNVEDMLAGGEPTFEMGVELLKCHKGSPKHKRYMKIRQEPKWARLQEKAEIEIMRDKRMSEIEAELFFVVDEKQRMIDLTDKGRQLLSPENPNYFVIDDIVDEFAKIEQREDLTPEDKETLKRETRAKHDQKAEELHAISQLLHAFILKQKDIDYVVEENKVVIVDENTGRKMTGRRWSDGLHQAVEAKEAVKIEAETQTLATITIQNYFRMYARLSGMTGTAETESAEFHSTYKMDVVVVPANKPTSRKDLDDVVFRTKREKYAAVLDEVERLHKMGLPVLVGTTNVQDSEKLSKMFSGRKLPHKVLNAKNHAQEAEIVAEAGREGSITVATNMAGRGTDIKLSAGVDVPRKDEGGNDWPGGLQIIGTERHESRRIDRQLRGRSGRQGDPGSSRFFVSLEDNLMLWFGSERISVWLQKLGMQEGEAIENPLVTRSITKAQKKVEMINHERRQRTLQYDNVMNKQRLQVYGLRREILVEDELRPTMLGIFEDAIEAEFGATFGNPESMGDANIAGWLDWIHGIIATDSFASMKGKSYPDYETLHSETMEHVAHAFDEKMEYLDEVATPFCRYIGLSTIDSDWQDHLLAIDDLREGINLRSYGQKDPLIEFTKDASGLFAEYMLNVNKNIFQTFFRAQPMSEEEVRERQARVRQVREQKAAASLEEEAAAAQRASQPSDDERQKSGLTPYRREYAKVGRNEPCPCGSGEKYKDCHGSPELKERVSHTVGGGSDEE